VALRSPKAFETEPIQIWTKVHINRLPAARCIAATVFGKIDDLPFPALRVRLLI
jgi:hypothetical protein